MLVSPEEVLVSKVLSPHAVVALKEALCSIYWYKADLRSFLQHCVSDRSLLTALDWNAYKRQIVSDLVDRLAASPDRHLGDLMKLCAAVTDMKEFKHLEQLEGGDQKAQRARDAVASLRGMMGPSKDSDDESARIAERQRLMAEKLKASAAVRDKLEDLKRRYGVMVVSANPQGRGFELEKLLYDIFELFDLDPKASFKNTGEQIDGAFSLDGTEYLFEGKWQKEPVAIQELDGFAGKVNRKLDNTLGLFLAINGFSPDAVTLHSGNRPSTILMDGADLMAVLEERIDFVSLLVRKKRYAAHTGSIYLPIHQIL